MTIHASKSVTAHEVSNRYARNLPEDERKKIIGMINIDSIAEKSDHYPFALLDIPAVSIVQEWQEGLHVNDSSDVKENLDTGRIVEVVNQVTDVISEIS